MTIFVVFFCKRGQRYDSNNLVSHIKCLLISIAHIVKSAQLARIRIIMHICFVFGKDMTKCP